MDADFRRYGLGRAKPTECNAAYVVSAGLTCGRGAGVVARMTRATPVKPAKDSHAVL